VLRDGVALLAPAGCTQAKVGATATTAAGGKMQNDVRKMCRPFDVQHIPDGRPERDCRIPSPVATKLSPARRAPCSPGDTSVLSVPWKTRPRREPRQASQGAHFKLTYGVAFVVR
jgi:hypothetical protein